MINFKNHKLIFLFSIIFFSCSEEKSEFEPSDSQIPPNILLIIADDLGKDYTNGYMEGNLKPQIPAIDNLRLKGLQFNNFWSYPTCSPTRASLITGKHAFKTNVLQPGDILSTNEKTLHSYIKEIPSNNYSNAVIGKWHLSGNNNMINPQTYGLDYFAGIIGGGVQDYYNWRLNTNGNISNSREYITKTLTDIAIDWIQNQNNPWFLWMSYNAPHTPFHTPPVQMHNQGSLPDYNDNLDPKPYYIAAIEAMDFQIGRLIQSIDVNEINNTLIIFIGDNGTQGMVSQSPYGRQKSKGTLYQGGINNPMFMSGFGVNRRGIDNNLVNTCDIFSTILEIAGSDQYDSMDGKSFLELLEINYEHRKFQYSEMQNGTQNSKSISNGNYKLIRKPNMDLFFNLKNDPYENNNLGVLNLNLIEKSALNELLSEIENIKN